MFPCTLNELQNTICGKVNELDLSFEDNSIAKIIQNNTPDALNSILYSGKKIYD